MIDKLCLFLTNKIRKEMPEVDDERAEIINYGIHLIVGEIPKIFLVLLIAYFLGVLKYTVLMVLMLLPYRACSGGFHLKTHIGCIVSTTLFYVGVPKISNYFIFYNPLKLILIIAIWSFGIIMISKYAPADTENVPILRKSERKQKKILSYIFLTVGLLAVIFIKNNEVSNILILSNFIQTIMITPVAYKITNNKYGIEVYGDASNSVLS